MIPQNTCFSFMGYVICKYAEGDWRISKGGYPISSAFCSEDAILVVSSL